MLRPRVIVSLLIHNGGLVKTVRFGSPKYVGDPINAVRIFNEKEVDELIVADIDASRKVREPNYELISRLAAECRMPICYGGGVKTVEQVEQLVSIGVEKVAISSAALSNPALITKAAERVGSQSVVVVMDVAGGGKLHEIVTLNGTHRTGREPGAFARQAQEMGAGEILVNSVDNDGMMGGYDLGLVSIVRKQTNIPLTVLGGAGSLQDVQILIKEFGLIGAAAGSMFVFKGKYKAVLISYPTREERDRLY